MNFRRGTSYVIGLSDSVIGVAILPVMHLTGRVRSQINPHILPRVIAYLAFLALLVAPFFAAGTAVLWFIDAAECGVM
ncbi:hypothetical protein [Leucobacter luti]|uniref:hypothetical protein n=1 Tax=Leucobacter luti TaxID=340320 RepID=UPI001053F8FB|nr:hypothetical protein [Leucobacter luti]MCW2289166.1 hypothetical protein [Leucobacter luti]QYM75006.1 hypothetical protein K1X41_09980 [Leucobacter luti]TCK46467.1 hypothetical protein EDF60_0010 [Leucobacter luti]